MSVVQVMRDKWVEGDGVPMQIRCGKEVMDAYAEELNNLRFMPARNPRPVFSSFFFMQDGETSPVVEDETLPAGEMEFDYA